MPRFFFDFSSAVATTDRDGTEFSNPQAAGDEAIKTLSAISRDEIGSGKSGAVTVVMRNAAGHALLVASLTVSVEWLGDTV